MKMSTKARYGLYAVVELSKRDAEIYVPVSELAAATGVTDKYLEQILAILKSSDIVTSLRGAGGGYKLTKPASETSVGVVLRALEDNLNIVGCLSGNCSARGGCVSHNLWQNLYAHINDYLNSITLEQLSEDNI
jgi:Rrf2 family protein